MTIMDRMALALDVGQSGIRIQILGVRGKEELEFAGIRTDLELFPQLVQVTARILETRPGPATVSIGMTGLTKSHANPSQLLQLLGHQVESLYLAHDSITGFLGSMALLQGTVTAVGTGVVTLSVGDERVARVDGWGNLIGDAGSAYWIGRAALEAGMKAYDGRAESTELTQLLWENFSHPEEAYIELQTDSNRVAVIAALAKKVVEMATSDAVAREIVDHAGRELAMSAAAAARQSGVLTSPSPVFSWSGNVMRAELLRQSFSKYLLELVPSAQITPPVGEPIDGVALLPLIPTNSPLRAEIYSAAKVDA